MTAEERQETGGDAREGEPGRTSAERQVLATSSSSSDVSPGKPPSTGLLLLRLAAVTFTPAPNASQWMTVDDGIQVQPLRTFDEGSGSKMLIAATQRLRYFPKVTVKGDVVVPSRERARAEQAIERAANLISVAHGARRYIGSPWPPVAFIGETHEARAWLSRRRGLLHGRLQSGALRTRDRVALDATILNALADRDDGVALMAEALGNSHATGRFHEFIRLFERAFRKPAKLLVSPMVEFLWHRFGYTEAELARWVEELRDPATHADIRPNIVFEPDVRPVVARMEQAAYDVLLNKEKWRSPSTARRSLWQPNSGTTSADGAAFIIQHTTPVTEAQLLDEFGSYPMDMAAVVSKRPADWWPKEDARTSESAQAPVQIIARE